MSASKNKMAEISDKEISRYKLIGSASGGSLGFCVYIAQRHTPNFFNRVVGYRIDKGGIGEMMSNAAKRAGLPEEKQKYITASFYEEKSIG